MKKARTRIIWGIVIVIIAVIVIARVFKKEEPVVPTPDPVVTVQTPHMGDILLTTDLVGTIEPADIVYIYPKAGGDVTAVNVKAGDVVAAGQVLLEGFSPPNMPSLMSVASVNFWTPALIPKLSPNSSSPVRLVLNILSAGTAVIVKSPAGWAFPLLARVMAAFILLLKSDKLVKIAFLFTLTVILESFNSPDFTTISAPSGSVSSSRNEMVTLAAEVVFWDVMVYSIPLMVWELADWALFFPGMLKCILSAPAAFPRGSPVTPSTVYPLASTRLPLLLSSCRFPALV